MTIIPTALYIAALVLALVALAERRGRSLSAWAIALLALGLTYAALG